MLNPEYSPAPREESNTETNRIRITSEGVPFSYKGRIQASPNYLENLVRHLDLQPFIRWQIGRKVINPALGSEGTGFEKYVAHLREPEQIVLYIAERGKADLDSIARYNRYNYRLLRELDDFIHHENHPIPGLKLWSELNTIIKADLARFGALRLQNKDSDSYYKFVAELAEKHPTFFQAQVINDNGVAGWIYKPTTNHLPILIPQHLPISTNNSALQYLSTNSMLEGFSFMQELGRTGDIVFRQLERRGLVQ